jgi:thiol-disulfide isomerase/thioredoxin
VRRRAGLAAAMACLSIAATVTSPARAAMTFTFKVASLSGGTISSEDFKGKIVVVDIWATWCGPCRLVIPHLVRLQETFKDKGVAVVGLNADEGAGAGPGHQTVERFVKKYEIGYPVGLMNGGTYREVARVMDFDEQEGFSLPTTIILDRDGTVIRRYPGYFPGQEREIEKLLTRMLEAEKPASPPARH